jgi:hypothetical protein
MNTLVSPSLFALLDEGLDYAGMFPPASLPLEAAMRNFIRYQAWPERWMLARFIVPAAKLGELAQLIEEGLAWDGTLAFSVLGGAEGFREGAMVEDFRIRFGKRVRVEVYETRFPRGEGVAAREALAEVMPVLHGAGLRPFFEAPFGPGWEARAGTLIRALAGEARAGFKLRTGGVTAEAFPSVEQVAWAVCACRDAGVPMKCTAGLHHPLRSFRAEVGTKMHGFLNVFVAGVLAWARGLDHAEVGQILAEEGTGGFAFETMGLAWRGRRATISEIEAVRRGGMLTFGSCSFEEPKEDLEALGFGLIKP